MKSLNNFFDKIFCINLDRRPDRWDACSELFKKENMIVEKFSAVDGTLLEHNTPLSNGQVGCYLSHYNLLLHCLEKKYNQVLIFEDDVAFDEGLSQFFFDNIDKVPEDWKFLYLGGNHLAQSTKLDENVHKMNYTLATHAYAVKLDIIPTILATLESDKMQHPVDVYYANLHRHIPSYVIKRGDSALIWQGDSYSDVAEAHASYDWLK
jgi:glycosyl transferase family 25